MATRKPMFMGTEGFHEEMAAADDMALGGLAMSGAITMGTSKITGLGDGSAAGDAVNKGQLDQAVISGGTFKEALLHESQPDDTEGVLAVAALTVAANPVSGDLITIDDDTVTRSYGATAGGDVQYTIGGTVAATMQNIVDAINNDATAVWTAYLSTDLDAIDTDGVIVIVEDDNDGVVSRVYGVWGTQASIQHVNFNGELDYTSKALTAMPAADPGIAGTNFGIRTTQSALVDGELHYVLNNDVVYGWDDSGNTWQTMSGSASIPDATSASGGGVKGKVTFDSDKGLDVVAGVAEVDIDEVTLDFSAGTIEVTGLPSLFEVNGTPVGATVTAANLDTLTDTSNADALHTHTAATATESPKVENTETTATDTVAVADPVYINGNDTVGKALANDDAKARVIGLIRLGAGAAPQSVEVVNHGIAASVLTAATFNTPYYLQAAGGIGTSLPGAGNRVIQMGKAKNADDLWVQIIDYGKKAA